MIITISGEPGAGSTTIARLLSKKTGYPILTVGEIHKKIAREQGLTVEEHWERLRKDEKKLEEFHKKIDEEQKKEASKHENLIINGKLSAFQIPNAELKVLLIAESRERARRIAGREGISQREALERMAEREAIERKEWRRMYGFDYVEDKNAYDMIIDSTNMTPEEIVEKIMEVIK